MTFETRRRRERIAAGAVIAAAAVTVTALAGSTARAAEPGSSFEIYGFAMLDWIQDTKRVDPNWQDAFRPSKIATPEGQFGSNGQSSLSVKQSRLGFKGTMPTGDSTPPINFKFEIDMFGVGVDAGQTTIRLRHAYGEWGQILAGQTNSVFMDIDIFPNVIDYWGPTGMVFFRNKQIRWTPLKTSTDEVAIAIEGPTNDVDPGNIREVDGLESATVRADQTVPDLTAHWRRDGDWGHFQLAGILRRVGFEYEVTGIPGAPFTKGSQTGWGINATGALKTIDKDKLLVGVVYGHGIASYMNDGGTDIAPTNDLTVSPVGNVASIGSEALPLTGVSAYYDHYWNTMWSTSIGYSFTQVNNTNFQAANAYHKGDYASVNLLCYPVQKLTVGVEALWGRRTNNDGTTGDDVRFQLSLNYAFGTKL